MRVDIREHTGIVPRHVVWLDGRRVENFVEMADDERGEVRFNPVTLAPMVLEIKTIFGHRLGDKAPIGLTDCQWHAPVDGELREATLRRSIIDRRYDIPGIGMIPLVVSGEVVIQRAA